MRASSYGAGRSTGSSRPAWIQLWDRELGIRAAQIAAAKRGVLCL